MVTGIATFGFITGARAVQKLAPIAKEAAFAFTSAFSAGTFNDAHNSVAKYNEQNSDAIKFARRESTGFMINAMRPMVDLAKVAPISPRG